jgi:hypothetical protein
MGGGLRGGDQQGADLGQLGVGADGSGLPGLLEQGADGPAEAVRCSAAGGGGRRGR